MDPLGVTAVLILVGVLTGLGGLAIGFATGLITRRWRGISPAAVTPLAPVPFPAPFRAPVRAPPPGTSSPIAGLPKPAAAAAAAVGRVAVLSGSKDSLLAASFSAVDDEAGEAGGPGGPGSPQARAAPPPGQSHRRLSPVSTLAPEPSAAAMRSASGMASAASARARPSAWTPAV